MDRKNEKIYEKFYPQEKKDDLWEEIFWKKGVKLVNLSNQWMGKYVVWAESR